MFEAWLLARESHGIRTLTHPYVTSVTKWTYYGREQTSLLTNIATIRRSLDWGWIFAHVLSSSLVVWSKQPRRCWENARVKDMRLKTAPRTTLWLAPGFYVPSAVLIRSSATSSASALAWLHFFQDFFLPISVANLGGNVENVLHFLPFLA